MKAIKINGIQWEIKINNNLTDDIFGETDYLYLVISINPKMKDDVVIKRTIMHEIIHAYLYCYGFTNKEKYELEPMIEFISHNFYNIEKLSNEVYQKLYKEADFK